MLDHHFLAMPAVVTELACPEPAPKGRSAGYANAHKDFVISDRCFGYCKFRRSHISVNQKVFLYRAIAKYFLLLLL